MEYTISVLTFAAIWAILALSLNMLLGYGGQASLGHAAFFGIGAYTAAILSTRYGVPFLLTIPLSMLVTALVGGVLGLPSLRVKHDFLVLVTIGLNFIVVGTFSYVDFFGGAMGIVNIPVPSVLGYPLKGIVYLAVCASALVFATWFSWHVPRTWGGLGLLALRDDELAAEAVGISHARYKIIAFMLSGALAGLGGALYAPFASNVFPGRFGFTESVTLVSMVIFGGVGTVRGAIFGGAFLKTLPEFLRFGGEFRFALYGGILLLTILFLPEGVLGDDSPVWKWLVRQWRNLTGKRPHEAIVSSPGDITHADLKLSSNTLTRADTLKVRNVSVNFGGLKALDDVSLNVNAGEILGLIGPNGAGKTTLFNAITGFVSITSGRISVNGAEIQGMSPHNAARAGVARTFQIVRPFKGMDVRHNMLTGLGVSMYPRLGAFWQRKDASLAQASALAGYVGLAERERTLTSLLPIGLLRHLEVGRALGTNARFLLLDEPAAGLTHEEIEELKKVVRGLAQQGHGVILVEHNMQFAMSLCERLVVLAAGKVLAEGSPEEVRHNPEVIAAYLGADE